MKKTGKLIIHDNGYLDQKEATTVRVVLDDEISISSLQLVSATKILTAKSSMQNMMQSEIKRLLLSALPVFSWGGLHLRRICSRRTGKLSPKATKSMLKDKNSLDDTEYLCYNSFWVRKPDTIYY